MSDTRTVRCDECRTIVFKMRNGLLIVESKHHGQTHTTVVTFETLREWMQTTDVDSRAA